MCRCLYKVEETRERNAIMEAELMHGQYGVNVIVEKDESNPFRKRYKILGFHDNCFKHFVKHLFPGTYNEIVYYLPRT